jgi:hypothetical protein
VCVVPDAATPGESPANRTITSDRRRNMSENSRAWSTALVSMFMNLAQSFAGIGEVRQQVAAAVIGREREQRLIISALAAERDLLLEGPPGTSKTTLLRAITNAFGVPLIFVEGNADLTTGRLVGHHDPAASLQQGFTEQTFVEGPLVRAMRLGGFLYIEEVNRAPEETLNALLTAIAEREISIPRAGTVRAKSGFRVVASMNPFDNIGTSRISTSVYDRLCRVAIDYQATEDEISIVSARTGSSDARLVGDSVALTRITRSHPSDPPGFERPGSHRPRSRGRPTTPADIREQLLSRRHLGRDARCSLGTGSSSRD